MAPPRVFALDTRRQINMYLHVDQYEFILSQAKQMGISPSALMRIYIDADRGVDRDKIGSKGTNKIQEENL